MKHLDEQVYLDKILNGDPASYAFLVNKYKDMVYSIAIKILRDADEAQDIAQECFITAYQQLHKYQRRSKFSTWLYTIVYRAAVTQLRRNKLDTTFIGDSVNEVLDNGNNQFDQLQAKQVGQQVRIAIDRLPPTEALLVTLYYINDLPVKEIQEITGLSKANIKIKLFRARKKLETELAFLLDDEKKLSNEQE
ncbi:RNA polymerase sigma factor [Mucilaginibacter calamicampi]|uniref:RNA polymerase sigma factor n=1 Tax=Mucilaginibacter calamicampi TaxID=1302352 RepID=A0ABW2YZE1_9SPHI